MKLDILSKKADYVGITGSVLCIIHCLATPVLLMTSSVFRHDSIRMGYLSLDYVFIALNITAVYYATRHQTAPLIKTLLWAFLSVFALAIVLEDVNEIFEYLGYAASAGLVMTHLANLRYCRLQHAH
ncbi:MerC domain-containing protein [Tellurirhabdus rosea]|uniref:MerC domain-containing protein n=1 Tax=Tellurirhabdus rosea TaxID=2674997 RepID=UPI00225B3488|nr:MerC domain-containing protein [Tellurirhabdus rosea]